MNNSSFKNIFNTILTASLVTTVGTVFAIKVNKHIDNWEKDCKVDNGKHIFCWAYLNEYGKNCVLIVLTFITTLVLGLILYYGFGII